MLNLTKKELICSRISTYNKLESSASLITDEAKKKLYVKKSGLLQEEEKLNEYYYDSQTENIEDTEDKLFKIGIELEHLDYDLETIIELEVMYLYKSYEYNIKRIIEWSFPPVNTDNLSNITKINNFLSKKGIELRQCNHFKQVDSLRKINNIIKHEGSLQKKHLKKIQCENLEQLNDLITNIKQSVEVFLENLIEKVSKKLMLNNSVEMNEKLEGLKLLSVFATNGGRYT